MKLAVIFTIAFFVLTLVGTTTISFYNYQTANEILINQVENHLKTTVQSRADHLDTFLDGLEKLALQMSQSVVINKLLMTNKTDEVYDSRLKDVMIRLNDSTRVNPQIYDIFILDKFGFVTVSNIDERVLLNRSDAKYFIYGREHVYIHDAYISRFFKGQPSIAVATPVYSETGESLGVIVIRINLDVLNTITTDRTGLGETGEIYLVNKDKLLITPSRFMDYSILVQTVDTENLKGCFSIQKSGEHKNYEPAMSFVDYRGEEVIGAHEYIQKMQWCLLAKIDKSEVFAQQRKLFIQNTAFVSITIIILLSFIGYFIGRFLDKNYYFQKKGISKNGKN